MKRALLAVAITLSLAGCGKRSTPSAAIVEPSGKLVWTHGDGGVTTDVLAKNYSGEKESFASSTSYVANGKDLGTIEWEFVSQTKRFGSILLVRIQLPDGVVSEHVLHDKAYSVIYTDKANRIEYVEK
jgi:hypothetical protein